MNDDLNIYQILEVVRKRPAIFFGSSDFHDSQAFIAGLTFILRKTSEKPPFRKFGSDNVFEKYFELLDEYKICRETYLEKALILETHKPNFYLITRSICRRAILLKQLRARLGGLRQIKSHDPFPPFGNAR